MKPLLGLRKVLVENDFQKHFRILFYDLDLPIQSLNAYQACRSHPPLLRYPHLHMLPFSCLRFNIDFFLLFTSLLQISGLSVVLKPYTLYSDNFLILRIVSCTGVSFFLKKRLFSTVLSLQFKMLCPFDALICPFLFCWLSAI